MERQRRLTRSPHSDERLARRIEQGDDGAFDELRDRYGHGLSRYASRLVGDLELGEDIACRALRDARRKLRSGSRPACVSPWLYRLTLNVALQLRSGCACEQAVAARLPERQRQAFVLREVYGLSVQEIAALGLSSREVQEAQFAARRRLARVTGYGRARRAEASTASSSRRLAVRPAVLAVAAAAIVLCIGMPVAATYAPDHVDDPAPALITPFRADRAL